MKTNTRFKISILLSGIILMINILQAGIVIEHYTKHIHAHDSQIENQHSDCSSTCMHQTKSMADEVCDGHFFHFMPQVSFKNISYSSHLPEMPTERKLFLIVKQYSSSYKHLFTTRGPPTIS